MDLDLDVQDFILWSLNKLNLHSVKNSKKIKKLTNEIKQRVSLVVV